MSMGMSIPPSLLNSLIDTSWIHKSAGEFSASNQLSVFMREIMGYYEKDEIL